MSVLVSNYSGLIVFTHSDCHQCFMLIENQYREGTLCPLVEHQSLLFSNIDIDFQIKTLNSMRLHNNKDSTKVLFTSQLQTEQFHTPLSLLLIILIFCVGCVCLSSSCVLCTQCYQFHWIIHS